MARTKLRSLRSAAIAVIATGVLSISIPLGLMLASGPLAPSAVIQQSPTRNVHLTSCDQQHPIKQLLLSPGDCVLVHAAGFAGAEQVRVHETGRPGWSQLIEADQAGRFSYRFLLDKQVHLGPDVLSFVGQSNRAGVAASSPESAQAHLAFCRFTVTDS